MDRINNDFLQEAEQINSIEDIISNFHAEGIDIAQIDPSQKYWLVRTLGGQYFNHYESENFIAIGYNHIPNINGQKEHIKQNIAASLYGPTKELDDLTAAEKSNVTRIYNQLYRFYCDIKIGDMVIVPGEGFVRFGIVESDVEVHHQAEEEHSADSSKCPFHKRRKVRWIKKLRKSELDLKLFKLFYSHHAISDAGAYAEAIDRSLYSFYIKGDKITLTYRANTQHAIPGPVLASFLDSYFKAIDALSGDGTSNDITVSLHLESPGPISFATISLKAAITIGILTVVLCGGNIEVVGLKFQTDGLIEKGLQVYERLENTERQNLDSAAQRLQISIPPEFKSSESATSKN